MTPLHLSAAFVERLGWVLVHSIWQFAFIALAALVLQRILQRASSATRYWVLLLALVTMMVAPVATWLAIPYEGQDAEVAAAEVPAASSEDAARPGQADVAGTAESDRDSAPLAQSMPGVFKPPAAALKKTTAAATPVESSRPDEQTPPATAYSFAAWWSWIEQGLRPWLNGLVIAWCVGVILFAMRPILSWYRVRRLRSVGVSAPPDAVQQMLARTADRLRLRQAVRVLQSTLVETAVVVGYFRPVILLPVSVVTGLPAAQLEAILAHELAHIRRHDYLFNLVQILVETVFFYHPAVWWLSNQIRNERENCCDDMAVAALGDRVEYGRALLALEEQREAATVLTMGAGGGSLLARVRRLLGRVPRGRAFSGGTIAGLGLLAAVVIALGVWAANGLGEADAEALAKEPDQVKKEGVTVKVPGSHTLGVALSPDGKILARAGTGKTIELWDVASGKKLHTLKGQSNMWPPVFNVAFSPDGKTLASATESKEAGKVDVEVKLWDVATGKERVPLSGHRGGVYSLAFSADGQTLATFHLDPGAVRLWDVATGKEKLKLDVAGTALAFSPDGKTLATFGDGVQLWDLTTGKKRASLPETRHTSLSLAFTPDGKTLVSAGSTEEKGKEKLWQLKLWDVATAKERATIALPEFDGMLSIPLVFMADGKTLITAGWIFEKDKAIQSGQITLPVARVSVQHLDLATGKAKVTFWTPVNPGGNHEFSGNVVGIYFAALSADGKTVAWGGAEGEGEKKNVGTAHVWEVQSLATSPPEIPKEVAEKNKEAAEHRKDIEDLNGTWKLRAVEVNGRRKDPKDLQTQMRINGSVLEMDTPEGHQSGHTVIDVSRRPKTMDLAFKGSDKPNYISVKAIYLLEGDRLTICRGRERTLPKGFDAITAIWTVEGKPTYNRPEGFNGSSFDSEPRPTEFKTQPEDGFTLEIYERVPPEQPIPVRPIFIKPGETKTVTLGNPGKESGPLTLDGKTPVGLPWEALKMEFTLNFADTDMPQGVTFEPESPPVKGPGEVPKFTVRAAQDAAPGDFAILTKAVPKSGGFAGPYVLYLSVDPAGEAGREPGKPRRGYRRLTPDPTMTQDGKLLSIEGGKLIIKSKDGTEHSYTLPDKFGSDRSSWQINYGGSGSTLEELKSRLADPATPVIVRVTATKAKPQEPTHIEASSSYDGFMAEYNERQRREKEQQEKERERQEIEHQKKVQQEIEHLQGTWLVTSSQTGDKKEPEESVKKQRFIIKGDHLTLAPGNEDNEKRDGTFKVDPQKKSLDWVTSKAGDATLKAIYELKGDDLKIGFGVNNVLRPTRFQMGQDQVGWLLVLKRAPPHWKPGEVTDQTEFTKLVVGTWHENRIRTGMKQPQILKFTANGDFEFFIADAQGGRWIKATYQVRSANRIWLDKLTENLDQENKRSIMQLALTRSDGGRPDTLLWICLLPEMSGTYERVSEKKDEVAENTKDIEELLSLTGHNVKSAYGTVQSDGWCRVCVSADGKRLLTSGSDSRLRLWDADTGKPLRVFAGHSDGVVGAALSPDGKRVLSAGVDNTVRLWDADTGQELRKITGPQAGGEIPVDSVSFGPAGQALSGGGYTDGTLRVWDLNTGKQAAVFSAGGYAVGVAYSAQARLAATYTWTRIRLWDLETGKEVRKLFGGHTSFVTSVCFSPDGERLLSSGWDGRVLIWDVQSGKVLQGFRADTHKEADIDGSGAACCAAFSPDGKRVVSGGKVAHVWDVESGQEVYKYEGHTVGVTGVAYFPDGRRIASAGGDGTVRVWRIPDPDTEQKSGKGQKLSAQQQGADDAAEAKAVEAITKLGGKITRDYKLPGKPVTTLVLNGPQVTDAGLKELKALKQLTSLNLGGAGVTDAGVKELAPLKQLTTLQLGGKVTDVGLAELKDLKRLTTLYLAGAGITDAGLKELADLQQLTYLSIDGGKVTDAGLKELADFKQLTYLYLGSAPVTGAGLKELKDLKQLTSLDLQFTPVTDAGLAELAHLKQLTALNLTATQVTDAGLKELKDLKQLTTLYLSSTRISDAGIA